MKKYLFSRENLVFRLADTIKLADVKYSVQRKDLAQTSGKGVEISQWSGSGSRGSFCEFAKKVKLPILL